MGLKSSRRYLRRPEKENGQKKDTKVLTLSEHSNGRKAPLWTPPFPAKRWVVEYDYFIEDEHVFAAPRTGSQEPERKTYDLSDENVQKDLLQSFARCQSNSDALQFTRSFGSLTDEITVEPSDIGEFLTAAASTAWLVKFSSVLKYAHVEKAAFTTLSRWSNITPILEVMSFNFHPSENEIKNFRGLSTSGHFGEVVNGWGFNVPIERRVFDDDPRRATLFAAETYLNRALEPILWKVYVHRVTEIINGSFTSKSVFKVASPWEALNVALLNHSVESTTIRKCRNPDCMEFGAFRRNQLYCNKSPDSCRKAAERSIGPSRSNRVSPDRKAK